MQPLHSFVTIIKKYFSQNTCELHSFSSADLIITHTVTDYEQTLRLEQATLVPLSNAGHLVLDV